MSLVRKGKINSMAVAGDGSDQSLEHTPTWALATVCFIIISVSLFIEHAIHLLSNWLKRHKKIALFGAVEKLKSELMLLGFMSLFLVVTQDYITKICIPANIADIMLPCRKEDASDEDQEDSAVAVDSCSAKGKVALVSEDAIHQLHIFIFVLAAMQIVFSTVTMGLGRAKTRRWKAWEKETQTTEYLVANVFFVANDLSAAGDGRQRPTPDAGDPHSVVAVDNFLSLPLSLSSPLSRGDSPPAPPPPTSAPAGRPPATPLSLFPFLSLLLSPAAPRPLASPRLARGAWGGGRTGQAGMPGVGGGGRKEKRERGIAGGRPAGAGAGGESPRERGEEREWGRERKSPAAVTDRGLDVGRRRRDGSPASVTCGGKIAGDGEDFGQFFKSVAKVDYLTLRHGFIAAHLSAMHNSFNFQQYIERSLDEDFSIVVGISPLMWFIVVILLLLDVHGWYVYSWLSYVPVLIVLAVGTKLEIIVARMALQIKQQNSVTIGTPLVKPNDDLFWFGKPNFVLTLLHYILFVNAYELAFTVWITVVCSYITLPLYALVTQMGSEFKSKVVEEQVGGIIKRWLAEVRERRKQQEAEQPLQSARPSNLSPEWSSRFPSSTSATEVHPFIRKKPCVVEITEEQEQEEQEERQIQRQSREAVTQEASSSYSRGPHQRVKVEIGVKRGDQS
ncbi:hypothetical protein TIFTF001_008341 [Ficus carica]|uniref:MLO-like protein n=1 Tax=Ficus carica TaxID=3494 RepID=A0AA88AEW7_FICCA|nr:hypothetical protein TIFTF001_008341 [Ficus carica]